LKIRLGEFSKSSAWHEFSTVQWKSMNGTKCGTCDASDSSSEKNRNESALMRAMSLCQVGLERSGVRMWFVWAVFRGSSASIRRR
jgi:hypothetical protein